MLRRSLFLLCSFLTFSLQARDTGAKGMGENVPNDADMILKVQIFLDQNFFGPGKLDGALGEFTYKAVVNYNFSHGHSDHYNWDHVIEKATVEIPETLIEHTVSEEHFSYVDPKLPEKPQEWVKFKAMHYRSMQELIAERYHTDETFLAKANPKVNLNNLKAGQKLWVPHVKPFSIETVKKYQAFKEDPSLSSHTVVVDTHERMAAIYDAEEKMLGAFPITPGKPQFIPRGKWKIVNMTTTPNFRYDKQFLEQGQRGDVAYQIPPGPNSPVGILWAGLSKSGIGLHGTAFPRTIGRTESAGCVRLANWDAVRLPQLVCPGSRVIVR
jgi:lipoprotein-anchoring transpeptidase ErfK/SrfK